MRVLFVTLFCLISAVTTTAQSPDGCHTELARSPRIRGIRLGMLDKDVTRILKIDAVPSVVHTTIHVRKKKGDGYEIYTPLIPASDYFTETPSALKRRNEVALSKRLVLAGESSLKLEKSEITKHTASPLEGIASVDARFFDGVLFELYISYFDWNGPRWDDVSEFVDSLSTNLGLARASWKPGLLDNSMLYQCSRYEINATTLAGFASVSLAEPAVKKEIPAIALRIYNESHAQSDRENKKRKRQFKP